jgi:hypothetical protein
MPRTCEVILSAMDKPAASSLALLTRKPDVNLAMETANAFSLVNRLRCATIEEILVLIIEVIQNSYSSKIAN